MPQPGIPVPDRNSRVTQLLMRHRAALFGYIFSCVTNHADAEDVLQEVSVTVTARFEQLRSDDEFLPWVLEIARRHILAHHRRSGRRPVLPPEVVMALADAAVQIDQDKRVRRTVEHLTECLDELPEQGAELIRARYDDSFESVQKLADSIGRTESATYSLIKRLRFTLRDCLRRKMAAEERA